MDRSRSSSRPRWAALLLAAGAVIAVDTYGAFPAAAKTERPASRPMLYVCISAEEDRWICDGTPGSA